MVEEWFDRSDHPLLNHVILDIVFEHVRPTDLRACRLVSTKWNLSTIPFTRSNWTVTIRENQNWKGIAHFVEAIVPNTLGIPFGRFRLEPFSMTDDAGQKFLKLCGNIANDIDLRILSSWFFSVQDISTLLLSTPNLVKFGIPVNIHSGTGNTTTVKLFRDDTKPKLIFLKKLTTLRDKPEDRIKCCPTFIQELMTIAENISDLSLAESYTDSSPTPTEYTSTSVEVLTIIEKLKRESFIQTLLFTEIHKEHVEILCRLKKGGMQLKKLTIINRRSFADHIQLSSFFKDSLRHLSIGGLCTSLMEFRKMPHLMSLSMGVSYNFDSNLVMLNNIFPALTKMELWGENTKYEDFLPVSDPCPKMKSFVVCGASMKLTAFNRIPQVFPNLIEFELSIKHDGDGVKVLRNIWTQMGQLEVLTLSGSILTRQSFDSIFTGTSTNTFLEYQDMVEKVNGLDKMTSEIRRETILELRNQYVQFPSILNLTNLRSLNVRLSTITTYSLTDLTGYLGLYPMKYLRHLSLDHCTITSTCCQILAEDTGLQVSHFSQPETVEYLYRMNSMGLEYAMKF